MKIVSQKGWVEETKVTQLSAAIYIYSTGRRLLQSERKAPPGNNSVEFSAANIKTKLI